MISLHGSSKSRFVSKLRPNLRTSLQLKEIHYRIATLLLTLLLGIPTLLMILLLIDVKYKLSRTQSIEV